MVKVFTIKEGVPTSIFGFESSQLARQDLFEELGVEHQIVLTNLGTLVPNFVEKLIDLGFKNFYHSIFDLSDLARQIPCVKEEALNLKGVSKIEKTNEGFVGLVYFEDGSVECYTSSLLYRLNKDNTIFELFDSQGVLLKGDVSSPYHVYENLRTGKLDSQWTLLVKYLAEHSTVDDKFIVDMVNEYPLQLRKFFQNTGRTLFAYTHYNILDPQMKFVLQTWCKNIVASPVLEEKLGSDLVTFLPPIYMKEGVEKEYTSVTDWCIVGNMTFMKRCELAIEVFRELPKEYTLTIYGNLPEGYTSDTLPSNVHFKGFVEEVPYKNHQGYLSCSRSECFANSAVEASANGLVCLLSDVDLAHRFYASKCENTQLFKTSEDLRSLLLAYRIGRCFNSSKFYSCYKHDFVLNLYSSVILG
jgi:hypothetical protein